MAERHQFRASWHDYNEGIYFVTVCCKNKRHLLGQITNGQIILSSSGKELQQWFERLKKIGKFEIINTVIMPNHFHILVGTRFCASTSTKEISHVNMGCLKPPMHGEAVSDFHHNSALAIFVGNLKGGVSRFARKNGIYFEWQPRYHEHIVRSQRAFDNIMNYIDNNIANWSGDCFNEADVVNNCFNDVDVVNNSFNDVDVVNNSFNDVDVVNNSFNDVDVVNNSFNDVDVQKHVRTIESGNHEA